MDYFLWIGGVGSAIAALGVLGCALRRARKKADAGSGDSGARDGTIAGRAASIAGEVQPVAQELALGAEAVAVKAAEVGPPIEGCFRGVGVRVDVLGWVCGSTCIYRKPVLGRINTDLCQQIVFVVVD